MVEFILAGGYGAEAAAAGSPGRDARLCTALHRADSRERLDRCHRPAHAQPQPAGPAARIQHTGQEPGRHPGQGQLSSVWLNTSFDTHKCLEDSALIKVLTGSISPLTQMLGELSIHHKAQHVSFDTNASRISHSSHCIHINQRRPSQQTKSAACCISILRICCLLRQPAVARLLHMIQ